jgi:DNA polymerase I-like protein with 3'-5' exonuclease and polymerase domains
MVDRIGVTEEVAKEAFERFLNRFPGIKEFQSKITGDFCSMTQPGGLGSKVVWKDPKPFVESIFGFRRYFTLENQITKTLFKLAEDPPKSWLDVKVKVQRREGRIQTAGNAVRSALFAAAFGIQGKCLRAATNHMIQSPGADITKHLEAELWTLQPVGVAPMKIKLLNIHDEVNSCMTPDVKDAAKAIVKKIVDHYRQHVPLIAMTWKEDLKSWAEK